MKKIFYLFVSLALVACGSSDDKKDTQAKDAEKCNLGVAEKSSAIEEKMNEKLRAAVEDKDSKAVVEAYEWYYGEMTEMMGEAKEFADKEVEIRKTRRVLEMELRDAKLPTETDKEEIEKLQEEYLKKVAKLAEADKK